MLASGLAGMALLHGAAHAQDDATRIVTHGAQGYSVDVAGTNLVQVLTEVGLFAGFTVEAPDHFNSPVNLTLQDVPLDQLLRRVLRNENYVIVYRGGVRKPEISGEQIDKIFLLSQAASGGGPAPKAAGAGSPLAGPGGAQPGGAPPGRGAPPPPPPPEPPNGDGENGGDAATRAARARARAEARRAALGEGAPGGMPEAARMVHNPEDFAPGNGGAPHGDVPPADVPPPDDGGDDGIPDEY